jgi:hypothetical protein
MSPKAKAISLITNHLSQQPPVKTAQLAERVCSCEFTQEVQVRRPTPFFRIPECIYCAGQSHLSWEPGTPVAGLLPEFVNEPWLLWASHFTPEPWQVSTGEVQPCWCWLHLAEALQPGNPGSSPILDSSVENEFIRRPFYWLLHTQAYFSLPSSDISAFLEPK